MDPFERQRRFAARFAVYASLLVVVASGVAFWLWLQRPLSMADDVDWFEVAWDEVPSVRLFQQYLRVDTTPHGDTLAGALLLATPLRAAGIPVTVERVGTQANLWARLDGEDPQALLLLSHIDVEEVEPHEPWEHPPFAGAIEPPHIWGRGSFDMKSYTVAQLWSLLDLRRATPRPARSVLLVATNGEERGSDLGVRWLLWRHEELFADLWGGLTEGGFVEARGVDAPKYWATEFGQKRFVTVDACAASQQRLEDLRRDIFERTGFPVSELRVLPEMTGFWAGYAATRDRDELVDLFSDPQRFHRDPEAFMRLPDYARSMLRDELVPLSLDRQDDGSWRLHMLLHLLPDSDVDEALARLLPEWTRGGVSLVVRADYGRPTTSPQEHALLDTVRATIVDHHPDAVTGLFVLPWTLTDSRHLRPRGVPMYGFTPFLIVTPETLRASHGNEKLSLPGFRDGVALYSDLVGRLAG